MHKRRPHQHQKPRVPLVGHHLGKPGKGLRDALDQVAVKRDPRLEKGAWMSAFAKISQKHIDYVLVNPNNGRVVCCIELDDPSHNRADRRRRVVFVNAAFEQADMPLLRVPTRRHYDANALRHQISAVSKDQKRVPSKVERGLRHTDDPRADGKKKLRRRLGKRVS